LGPARGAIGWEASVADFVEQGAVADIQGAGSLFAIPMVMLQNF
jgi:hypothetical protein